MRVIAKINKLINKQAQILCLKGTHMGVGVEENVAVYLWNILYFDFSSC